MLQLTMDLRFKYKSSLQGTSERPDSLSSEAHFRPTDASNPTLARRDSTRHDPDRGHSLETNNSAGEEAQRLSIRMPAIRSCRFL